MGIVAPTKLVLHSEPLECTSPASAGAELFAVKPRSSAQQTILASGISLPGISSLIHQPQPRSVIRR